MLFTTSGGRLAGLGIIIVVVITIICFLARDIWAKVHSFTLNHLFIVRAAVCCCGLVSTLPIFDPEPLVNYKHIHQFIFIGW